MRTIFTNDDVKDIVETTFNGNLQEWKRTRGTTPYSNPNSASIDIEENDEIKNVDIAKYLDLEFFVWKNRVMHEHGEYLDVDEWLDSLNFANNRCLGLVEITDNVSQSSQDLDMATINGSITFVVPTNKVDLLDYYVGKLRNEYLGKPQTINSRYGINLTAFMSWGILLYNNQPQMTQFGEMLICTLNFAISYINEAYNYNDTKIELSMDDNDYYPLPYSKATHNVVFNGNAVTLQNNANRVGQINESATVSFAITYFEFKGGISDLITTRMNELCAYRIGSTEQSYKQVNVPMYVKLIQNGVTYYYNCVITQFIKNMTNADINVISITLSQQG